MKTRSIFIGIIFIIASRIFVVKADELAVSNFAGKYSYFSQFSETNLGIFDCGPAVLKIVLSGFMNVDEINYTDIRRDIGVQKSIMYVSEIEKGLTYYGVPYRIENFIDKQTLMDILNDEKIAILCINMEQIRSVKGQDNKFYGKNVESLTTGHFVVLTGYKVEGDKLYFEVLDPYNRKIGNKYIYEEICYYESESLERAIREWSNEVIVIEDI